MIDESAKEMRREIIENQVTEEQIQEELGAAMQAKAEKEEREYQ